MRFDARRLVLSLGILLLSSATAFSQDKAAAIESLLKRHQDVGAFNGTALVAENGKVIFKKGYGLADFEWKIPQHARHEVPCSGRSPSSSRPR